MSLIALELSARFAFTGSTGYKEAYLSKKIRTLTNVHGIGFFRLSQSELTNNGEFFRIITLQYNGVTVAWAGIMRVAGQPRWWLVVRTATSYKTASGTVPRRFIWHHIEPFWRRSTIGVSELRINGVRAAYTGFVNTTWIAGVNHVHVALTYVRSTSGNGVYRDNVRIFMVT